MSLLSPRSDKPQIKQYNISCENLKIEHIKFLKIACNLFDEQLEIRLGLSQLKLSDSSIDESSSFAGLVNNN